MEPLTTKTAIDFRNDTLANEVIERLPWSEYREAPANPGAMTLDPNNPVVKQLVHDTVAKTLELNTGV